MRKLMFILIAFIAVATFIRAFDGKPLASAGHEDNPSVLTSEK